MSKHTPVSKQRRLVALWRRSDQPKSAFARSHHIHPNTFWAWTRRHGVEAAAVQPAAGSFIDVTPPASTGSLTVRLGAPGHARCELGFETLPPAAWFASVLQEVAGC